MLEFLASAEEELEEPEVEERSPPEVLEAEERLPHQDSGYSVSH